MLSLTNFYIISGIPVIVVCAKLLSSLAIRTPSFWYFCAVLRPHLYPSNSYGTLKLSRSPGAARGAPTRKSYILISQNVAFNLEGKVKIDIFKKHRDYSQLNLVSRVNSYFCTIGQQSFPMLSRLKSINNAAFT